MSEKSGTFKNVIISVLTIIVGAFAISAIALPTRVSVLENNVHIFKDDFNARLDMMDRKLDRILEGQRR